MRTSMKVKRFVHIIKNILKKVWFKFGYIKNNKFSIYAASNNAVPRPRFVIGCQMKMGKKPTVIQR